MKEIEWLDKVKKNFEEPPPRDFKKFKDVLISLNPIGRVEQVLNWTEAGIITQQDAVDLLDDGDLDAYLHYLDRENENI